MQYSERQKLANRLPLLSPFDGDYVVLPFPNEVVKVTDRAALIAFRNPDGEWKRAWIPQSLMRVDSMGNCYVQAWYFVRHLK